MNYGDLGKRFVAYLIDNFLLALVYAVLWYLVWRGILPLPVLILFIPLFSVVYYVAMEGGNWHATLGKRIMGLYVADEKGLGVSYSGAILRIIGKMLSALTLGLGCLTCFFNAQKQCLHDMIAKTYVLDGRAGGVPLLVCVSGPLAGFSCQVSETGVTIGRDSVSCQVVIPPTQSNISRIHCVLTYNPSSNTFVVNDRRSSMGTFLANGRRIPYGKPAALRSGERFYLATPENTFEVR